MTENPGMIFTYEEVDRIRSRDLRLIGELMETERNLVEQLGRATVRAENWEDQCMRMQAANKDDAAS